MKNEQRLSYVTRAHIMNLLTDEENAKVSMAETAKNLRVGEEYIDLTRVEKGVLESSLASSVPTGHVLPKQAVHPDTWVKILRELSPPKAAR